ncbi:BTAD domain-containing putative transcriptional regulator [Saccharomonospora sp. NPDC006951]
MTGPAPGVGGTLREFRRRAGVTQRELAMLTDLSLAGLRDLEQGRVKAPRPGTVRRLAAALRLSPAEAELLANGEPEPRQRRSGEGLAVLGPLRGTVAGKPLDLGPPAQQALLAVLALSANRAVSRSALVAAVWGPLAPPSAEDSLPSRMSRLRRGLKGESDGTAGPVLVASRGGYRLSIAEEQLDLLRFRKLCAEAELAGRRGAPSSACALYAEASALWRGEPLADLPMLSNHPAVTALAKERRAMVLRFAAAAAAAGTPEVALPALWVAVTADSLHEKLHAALMIALLSSGQQSEALTVFTGLRDRLAKELGTSPGPELMAAHRRVLHHDLPAVIRTPLTAVRQLPADSSDFAGRTVELAALRRGLSGTDGGPVVRVISGMGGTGKTRLALKLAHELVAEGRYAEQQLHADLRGRAAKPPEDPRAVLGTFLRSLGLSDDEIPHELAARAAKYRNLLHDRSAVVVLDDAADARQVAPLLPSGGENLVLVTSRTELTLPRAHHLALGALTGAESRQLLTTMLSEAIVEREPAATARLVELCGGSPLALALVGRRLRVRPAWGLADLLTRLDTPEQRMAELALGGRSVKAALDLSYESLPEREQHVLRLLARRSGAQFTAGTAAVFAGVSVPTAESALNRLAAEHLLIRLPPARFGVPKLVSDYVRVLPTPLPLGSLLGGAGEKVVPEAALRTLAGA